MTSLGFILSSTALEENQKEIQNLIQMLFASICQGVFQFYTHKK